MARDSFVIFKNWTEAIDALPEEFQLECYKALAAYGLSGKIPQDVSAVCKAMLTSFSVGMENAINRWHASAENGKKGGNPKFKRGQPNLYYAKEITEDNLDITKDNLDITKDNLDITEDNLNVNVNDNDNVNENENENGNVNENAKKDECVREARARKKSYGKFENVLLTEQEYAELVSLPDGQDAIEVFSEYREMKGYKAQNDFLAIRKWAFLAVEEKRQRELRSSASARAAPPQQAENGMLAEAAKRLLGQ